MKLNILIPSLGRLEKLLKAIGSIADAQKFVQNHYTYFYIYFSHPQDYKDIEPYINNYKWILPKMLDKPYKASEFWNDRFNELIGDLFFYLNDDIVLHPECLSKCVELMDSKFPDLNGAIGINQENIPKDQQCKGAFGCLGTEFINSFQNKQVFCPSYERFYLDSELYEYASKTNRFYFSEEAKLIHLHPAFDKTQEDGTHHNVRQYLREDRITNNKRKAKNLLWGDSFEL